MQNGGFVNKIQGVRLSVAKIHRHVFENPGFMADGSEERFYGRLNTVEKDLSEGRQEFLRIHQSFLVNYSYIEKMNFSVVTVIFGNGKRTALKISEDREKAVRSRLCGMAGRKAVDG